MISHSSIFITKMLLKQLIFNSKNVGNHCVKGPMIRLLVCLRPSNTPINHTSISSRQSIFTARICWKSFC